MVPSVSLGREHAHPLGLVQSPLDVVPLVQFVDEVRLRTTDHALAAEVTAVGHVLAVAGEGRHGRQLHTLGRLHGEQECSGRVATMAFRYLREQRQETPEFRRIPVTTFPAFVLEGDLVGADRSRVGTADARDVLAVAGQHGAGLHDVDEVFTNMPGLGVRDARPLRSVP